MIAPIIRSVYLISIVLGVIWLLLHVPRWMLVTASLGAVVWMLARDGWFRRMWETRHPFRR